MPAICATELKYTCPIVNKKSYMAFVPATVLAAGIAVLSLWENPCLPEGFAGSDKMWHGLMYALLSAALMGGFILIRQARIRMYVYAVLAASAYGALLELLQHCCTATRTGEMMDVYADCLGAIIGVLVVALLYYGRRCVKRK